MLADSLALTLINSRQIAGNGFSGTESGGVTMNDATRNEILVACQLCKQEEIFHLFRNELTTFGRVPFVQSLLLAHHLRGDLDAYHSFIWR